MKIFISQSGQTSRAIALALKEWMPLVLHYVEPWVSQKDIAAGDRWWIEVGTKLSDSNFGIICLTPENLTAPWILFESGAISKSFSEGAVCPYLYKVEYSDLTGPLAQFQGKKADHQSTRELMESINSRYTTPVKVSHFEKLFDKFWPELESQLNGIPAPTSDIPEVRATGEVLEDLVQSVRSMESRFRDFGDRLSIHDSVIQPITRYYNEARKIAVVIHAPQSIGTLKNGDKLSVNTHLTNLIPTIAYQLGLDKDDYGKKWHLRDQESERRLTPDTLAGLPEKYKGKVCFLDVEDDDYIRF